MTRKSKSKIDDRFRRRLRKVQGEQQKKVKRQQPKTLEKEQHGGSHYKSMPIQPAEYNQLNGDHFGWNEGEAIKLISRHRSKNGAQDLKKAIHYIKIALELDYNETYDPEAE